MPDITIALTGRLERSLRNAALTEIECGADDLQHAILRAFPLGGDQEFDQADIDKGRQRLEAGFSLIDGLGYREGKRPIESLPAPVQAMAAVATVALEDLNHWIAERGEEPDTPQELRDSADLWEQLESIRAQAREHGAAVRPPRPFYPVGREDAEVPT